MPSKKKNNSKSSRRRSGGGRLPSAGPPSMRGNMPFLHRTRYISNNGISENFTRANLLSHLLTSTGSGTTNNVRLLQAIRIKSIDIWATPPSVGTSISASLYWLSEEGPAITILDTALGNSEPLHIHSRPPKGSLAGFWCTAGSYESDAMFEMTVPAGAIIDVLFECVMGDTINSGLITTSTTGANGAGVYVCCLGGPTQSNFAPIAVQSIY